MEINIEKTSYFKNHNITFIKDKNISIPDILMNIRCIYSILSEYDTKNIHNIYTQAKITNKIPRIINHIEIPILIQYKNTIIYIMILMLIIGVFVYIQLAKIHKQQRKIMLKNLSMIR